MIIFLDESGDLGFDFSRAGASHYLIMTCLICDSVQSVQSVAKAVRLTLKNKLPANIPELKGGNTTLPIKKYFLQKIEKINEWRVMTIAADKRAWLWKHSNTASRIDKNLFYDEVAKRLLSQIEVMQGVERLQLVVDKSKAPGALRDFDRRVSAMLRTFVSEKTPIFIKHRHSFSDTGLQAIDLFSWGVFRKYQHLDTEWYDIFQHRIALEMGFRF